jgi:hypothetical protein
MKEAKKTKARKNNGNNGHEADNACARPTQLSLITCQLGLRSNDVEEE